MTRQEALDKTADFLEEAETSVSEQHWQKSITLAQLYLGFAHELAEHVQS